MKKIVMVIMFLSIMVGGSLYAQGIKFEDITFEEALQKAKQEDKLVFIDFYTVWCAPCKVMAYNVFTDSRVGNLFNRQFINITLDAEKEGMPTARKYGVNAYPTLMFINGNGEMVYKSVGSRDIATTLKMGNEAEASRTSEYSLIKLKTLFPQKQNDERFLKMYISKMTEYGQNPAEGIEAWLKIQTEIKENDVDMMEFLLNHSKYLMVDGKAEEILKANMDEYMDIATRKEELELKNLPLKMAKNTLNAAYQQKSPELMRAFITNWKELSDSSLNSSALMNYEMDCRLLAKDVDGFKRLASVFIDSIMKAKTIEQIRVEDKAKYEDYKNTKYTPSLMGNATLESYRKGYEALAQMNAIKRTGSQFLRHCDNKQDYKRLYSWIDYGAKLVPEDYSMDDLRAAALYKQGNTKKAIEYKEAALNKLSDKDKAKPNVESELNKMKNGEKLF